ncbi:MAG: MBL fold metallo-hydrolase [Bacillota bacterium]
MEIKWHGTASLSFAEAGETILTDPFFPMNRRIRRFDIGEIAGAVGILITHGHFDHLVDVPSCYSKTWRGFKVSFEFFE